MRKVESVDVRCLTRGNGLALGSIKTGCYRRVPKVPKHFGLALRQTLRRARPAFFLHASLRGVQFTNRVKLMK